MRVPAARSVGALVAGWASSAVPQLLTYLESVEDGTAEFSWLTIARGAVLSVITAVTAYLALRARPPAETPAPEPEQPTGTTSASDALERARLPRAVPYDEPNGFIFGRQSREVLSRADEDLASVHRRALELTEIDFACYESTREVAKQSENIAAGVSWTMDSRHLERPAKAVDHVPIVMGKECWDWWAFEATTNALKRAAAELGIACTHGIDWPGKKRDGPHTELDRAVYPFNLPDVVLA